MTQLINNAFCHVSKMLGSISTCANFYMTIAIKSISGVTVKQKKSKHFFSIFNLVRHIHVFLAARVSHTQKLGSSVATLATERWARVQSIPAQATQQLACFQHTD